jgi:meiotic cell cortex pleckstrin-like protein
LLLTHVNVNGLERYVSKTTLRIYRQFRSRSGPGRSLELRNMAVTEYFSELEAVGSNSVTPSPVGSAYHTPRASMSRRSSSRRAVSSRGGSSSPPRDNSSSPPPLPGSSPGTNVTNDDKNNDDDILIDPRRFTPTLHASLVSEILNLRRELDSKHKFIEDLEVSLQHAKIEKDEVSDQLSHVEKDRRNLKRQFQQLENGTLSALEELAKDRDETKKQNEDLKKKVDDAHEKIKRKEEESDRTHAAWEKEQNAWETERRAFDRRIHITETRLKTVLAELEAAHQAHAQMQETFVSAEDDDNTKDSGLGDESDTASQASPRRNGSHKRSTSNSSRRSFNRYRFSVQSVSGVDGPKINGISLADELQLDEEDEDAMSEADSEHPHQDPGYKRSVVSRTSLYNEDKIKRTSPAKVLQAPIEFGSPKPGEQSSILTTVSDPIRPVVQYVDSGVQFTPPSSPKLLPQPNSVVAPEYCDTGIQLDFSEFEHSLPHGNETRKDSKVGVYPMDLRSNMSTPPPLIDRAVSPIDSPTKSRSSMVSAGSQTVEEPLSPPATPEVSPPLSPKEFVNLQVPRPELKTIATQTDFVDDTKPFTVSATERRPHPILIPSITITEPPSAPSSPGEPKLPPGTKSISCQTTSDLVTTTSVSVQTEEIRIDTRLAKLPPHLRPSAILSNFASPDSLKSKPSLKKKTSLGNSINDRAPVRSPSPSADEIPSSPPTIYAPVPLKKAELGGNVEHNSAAAERVEGLRKMLRSSVLAPAFQSEEDHNERDEPMNKGDFIQTEPKVAAFSTPNMSSRSMKHLRQLGGTRPSPVPEEKDEHDYSPEAFPARQDHVLPAASGRNSVDMDKSKSGRAMSIKSGSSKQTSMRRSAMIQNGSAAHRSRTPSMTSVGSSSYFSSRSGGPPFPVPDRGSSRKLFESRSEGSSSPTPRSGIFSSRKRANITLSRKDSLRKVKSATTIQRSNSRGRNRSRSPPLHPSPLSPNYPPLPKDNIAIPSKVYPSQKSGEKRLSRPLSPSSKPELARASQGTVVDAIAATMVGEWMWKYVRRRTSFGVSESPQDQIGRPGTDGTINVTGNGVRHRRWVWLSPYERAIMWSSKQPASNSALMGKSGRKRE